MAEKYSLTDVVNSYRWLGHNPAYSEVNALHPEYKPGQANKESNLKKNAFPKVAYIAFEDELVSFVEKYSNTRMVCYGLNPRTGILTNDRGYIRSALDADIEIAKNLLFDFDIQDKSSVGKQLGNVESFFKKAEQYFHDLGLKAPVCGFSGAGYHWLFAFSEISVVDFPDIRQRQKEFRDRFERSYRREMESIGVRLDDTTDLKRMVKIYGTAKPEVGVISRFYGGERIEDSALVHHLFSLRIPEQPSSGLELKTAQELPAWFKELVDKDAELRHLWAGSGKPDGTDTSRTGFDYSIAKRLLRLGYRNLDDIATILALRPNGAVREHGKSEQYILRTIANALIK